MPDQIVETSDSAQVGVGDFYWHQARDSSLTPLAIQLFQLAAKHDGEDFDTAKHLIDREYATLTGNVSERHGGKFQTAIQAYRETGWIATHDGKLSITPAGRQALAILGDLPSFLVAIPPFLLELLARFQLNNPERPPVRGEGATTLRESSDIFPYWTIWKVMRESDNRITIEELQRFVLRLHRHEDIERAVESIREFRSDVDSGKTAAELDLKYPPRLTGANAETKYWMGRAGTQIGGSPPLIEKPNSSTYEFNRYYLPMIDAVLANKPVFQEALSAETWMTDFGRPVNLEPTFDDPSDGSEPAEQSEQIDVQIDDGDALALEVAELIEDGSRAFLLTGPPGTSKSWYARQLAMKIVAGDPDQIRLVQFHASYGYEDFIEGFVPEVVPGQQLPSFVRKWKVFAEACDLARNGEMAVLVIDEFSRGDAGRIFGEALTYMEPDYRDTQFRLSSGRSFLIPANLVIIATMNPDDRSVSAIDVAMQRRFEVIQMKPDPEILKHLLARNGVDDELAGRILDFFTLCQEVTPHGGLGHAYFMTVKDEKSLQRLWDYKLSPLFEQELKYLPEDLERISFAFDALIAGW
tara:strand:+ start:2624 stop:4369 length:1746 start_codon:yes stop_codon:yes gene_type:complete